MKIALKLIKPDSQTQSRCALIPEVIEEYAEVYRTKPDEMRAIRLVWDGEWYYIEDGWHRYSGALQAAVESIEADTRDGTLRDAILGSLKANGDHGLRPNAEDAKKRVRTALGDPEWSERSDTWIAEHCNATHKLVAKIRKESHKEELTRSGSSQPSPMRTGRDGRKQKPRFQAEKKPKPEAAAAPVDDRKDQLASFWGKKEGGGQPPKSSTGKATEAKPMTRTELNRAKREERGESPPTPKATGKLKQLEDKFVKIMGGVRRSLDDAVNTLKAIQDESLYPEDCFGKFCERRFEIDWDSSNDHESNKMRILQAMIDQHNEK